MTSKMDYKKKLMEYRKLIGATTTSAIMGTVAFRDSASNLDKLDNQKNMSQQNLHQQHRLQNRALYSVEKDEFFGENRRSTTREYRKSTGAAIASPIMRDVLFRDSALNLDKLDNEKDNSQQNLHQQQFLQHRTLFSIEDDNYINENKRSTTSEYKKSTGASIASPVMRNVSFRDSASNLGKPDNQNNNLQINVQSQKHQQYRKPLKVEEHNFVCEDRQSATREQSDLRVSPSSPSPQPQSQQSVLSTSGYLRETSFLLEPTGRYVNWNSHHAFLASQSWCCIGNLMALCDKYEFKAISVSDVQVHTNIVSEVRSLLSGKAPFDMRRRFPGSIQNTENLFVCIGRCPSIEYHLERILTAFRRPLNKISIEKQYIAKQNFHLAIRELHLDISARISEIKLYDRNVFEKEFHLKWHNNLE